MRQFNICQLNLSYRVSQLIRRYCKFGFYHFKRYHGTVRVDIIELNLLTHCWLYVLQYITNDRENINCRCFSSFFWTKLPQFWYFPYSKPFRNTSLVPMDYLLGKCTRNNTKGLEVSPQSTKKGLVVICGLNERLLVVASVHKVYLEL